MKVAIVNTYPFDTINDGWSGLRFSIAQTLKMCGIDVIPTKLLVEKWSASDRIIDIYYNHFTSKKHYMNYTPGVSKAFAKQIQTQLKSLDCDILLNIAASYPVAYLQCDKPIVIWSDATFKNLEGFYFKNFCGRTLKEANELEKQALDICTSAVFSNDWASQSAISDYQINPWKIKTIPFGANLIPDQSQEDLFGIIARRPYDQCRLLFVGVEWERKGGDTAVQIAKALNQKGLPTKLTVIGCSPSLSREDPVEVIGKLNKADPRELQLFKQFFLESHFLILPARAECCAVVLSEANAFGVPALASDVGGNRTAVKDHVNGKLFPLSVDVDQYANYIYNLLSNRSYESLARSSLQEYYDRLNWQVAGRTMKKHFEEIIAKHRK